MAAITKRHLKDIFDRIIASNALSLVRDVLCYYGMVARHYKCYSDIPVVDYSDMLRAYWSPPALNWSTSITLGSFFEGTLISTEEIMEVIVMARQGVSIRHIAEQTQLPRNTVLRYLRDAAAQVRKPAPIRTNKLDSFKVFITERLAAARPHWIPATVMLREIQALGYRGQIATLRMFMMSCKGYFFLG